MKTIGREQESPKSISCTGLVSLVLYELTQKGTKPFPLKRVTEVYYKTGFFNYDFTVHTDGRIFSSDLASDFRILKMAGDIEINKDNEVILTERGIKFTEKSSTASWTASIRKKIRETSPDIELTPEPEFVLDENLKSILHTDSLT